MTVRIGQTLAARLVATVVATVLLVLLLIVTTIQYRSQRGWVSYDVA